MSLLIISIFFSFGTVNSEQNNLEITAIEPQQIAKLDFRGLAYGPFRGVGPDRTEIVTKANVEEDMQILEDLGVNHIRTYGIGLGLNLLTICS